MLQKNQCTIEFTGRIFVLPSVVHCDITSLPDRYVMYALNSVGIRSDWDGHNWHRTTSATMDLNNMKAGAGNMSIYLNGPLVQKVNGIYAKDPSTNDLTTYMPVWYVMQILHRVGITSTWDGSHWVMTSAN